VRATSIFSKGTVEEQSIEKNESAVDERVFQFESAEIHQGWFVTMQSFEMNAQQLTKNSAIVSNLPSQANNPPRHFFLRNRGSAIYVKYFKMLERSLF
jgi:hypothetical protein